MKNSFWVIKIGGSLLSHHRSRRTFLRQASTLSKRCPVVLVHGGGAEITAALKKVRIHPRFVQGRRVTTDAAMRVVERVLSGQINKALVGELSAMGAAAVGVSGRDGGILFARPVRKLGRVGVPVRSQPKMLKKLGESGFLPVVSSVAAQVRNPRRSLNVNADEAAAALAVGLKAKRLVFMTNVAGVLDSRGRVLPTVRCRHIPKLIKQKVITGGMIPKILSCRNAIQKGVQEVDIVNGRAGLKRLKGTRIIP